MIITIDGPAGSGKSTVARALARRLGFRFLDTGAMYRAVALAGVRDGVDFDRPDQLAQLAEMIEIDVSEDRVLLDGQDVTQAIRSSEVTAATRHAADDPAVRDRLVRLQREAAAGQSIVTEGRDQGSVVFPDAPCKFFLTAGPEERARRRLNDLQAQGESATLEAVLEAQQRRDSEDTGRPVGPLVRAADAIEVCTDRMSLEEVVDRLESIVRKSL
ncbi:MAG: (d)CMP kinase [Thermoguttaceae bacterium]